MEFHLRRTNNVSSRRGRHLVPSVASDMFGQEIECESVVTVMCASKL
jgi:hypothetical protein